MDQHLNNSQNEFLWTLLANPANDAHLYANNLRMLVNDFPQSGILQALLAHASDEKNLRQASVYFNAKSLYKLINAPLTFTGVPDERIIIQTDIGANGHHHENESLQVEENLVTQPGENIGSSINDSHLNGHSVIETEQEAVVNTEDHLPAIEHEAGSQLNNQLTDEQNLTESVPKITDAEEPAENKVTESNEEVSPAATSTLHEPELVHIDNVENETHAEPEDKNTTGEAIGTVGDAPGIEPFEQESEKSINDETFDEIIGIEQINIEPETNKAEEPVQEGVKIPEEKAEPVTAIKDEADELIKGNIASTDFFMFDKAFGGHKAVEEVESKPADLSANTVKTASPDESHHQDVSKYNDEKMPYTFMWWLDKTRKEHSKVYQPYVKPETSNLSTKPQSATDELQQQYFENIFHITSVDELDKSTPQPAVPYNIKRKEHVIIERFIKEEPQIKPQSSDKLDNENKAKKSSEDRDELVTETLAAIYSDQMLYHKAIASYKKLMLKFPEKSRYFAGKIEQLEKKTN